MSKVNFAQRVIDFLKGGEEAKISRFHKKALKHLNDQIKLREDAIDELKEKSADLREEYDEAVYNIDLDSIKSTEDIKMYVESYTDKLFNYELRIKELEDAIEERQLEIDYHKRLVDKIK